MELSLVPLLRAAWLAGILPIVVASVPCSRLRFFRERLMGFAKRGKILDSSSRRFTVPQSFFLHFYVIAAVWTTLLLLSTWFYAYMTTGSLASEPFHFSTVASHLFGGSHVFSIHKSHSAPTKHKDSVWRVIFLLLLMEVQVLRRLYETLYVFNYSPKARMHIFGYLTGLYFYMAAPLTLSSSCALEALRYSARQVPLFIIKRLGQGPDVKFDWCGCLTPFLKLQSAQWIGAAIFVWGWIHQLNCHAILGSLRERKEQVCDYAIPYGDWFQLVSCPHYLAEIVIYAGLLIASGGMDITIWLLFGFVVANLGFAAAETHQWYHNKFDNYPRSRRAIVPFIY